MPHQSIVTQIRNNKDYQCVSLQPETATKALKVARKAGQRIHVVAESFGRKHIIFVAKNFQDEAWVDDFFKTANDISKAFSFQGQGPFEFFAGCEYVASLARLSAAVNGCVYCCDEVLSCGSFRLFFHKL